MEILSAEERRYRAAFTGFTPWPDAAWFQSGYLEFIWCDCEGGAGAKPALEKVPLTSHLKLQKFFVLSTEQLPSNIGYCQEGHAKTICTVDIYTCPDYLLMNTCGISPCTVMWFNKLENLHILSLYISQPQLGSCYHFRNSPLQHYHLTTSYLLISTFLKLIEIEQSYQTTLLTLSKKNVKKYCVDI